ncbi:unnamed protein product [Triticum turgidum subsp. durum]|uniref:HMA domain-containing protein n=1 Tax=Triticum turgidum subsp. durum TaxID=4567 RepID=A0A9R1RA48_TRITD|nr:unnamed protein product [Triticum turgidum subsp. durum]
MLHPRMFIYTFQVPFPHTILLCSVHSRRSACYLFPVQSVTVNVRVYMHCDACERSVRRTIKKIDGVETVEVDREENKVMVTGDFKAEKVLRKLKKKTGKKAEILPPDPEEENQEEEKQEPDDDAYAPYGYGRPAPDMDAVLGNEFQRPPRWDLHYFDDENTEASRIM